MGAVIVWCLSRADALLLLCCESQTVESVYSVGVHSTALSSTTNGETLPVPELRATPPSDTVETELPSDQFLQTWDQGKRGAQGLARASRSKTSDPKFGSTLKKKLIWSDW